MLLLHDILVQGATSGLCCERVANFFTSYQLIRYDSVTIPEDRIVSPSHHSFWPRIDKGVQANRDTLASFLAELAHQDDTTITDLAFLPQGYQTALLHAACHILDGFFGIDTCFYNLEEDSHWVSDVLRRKIRKTPGAYHLLEVKAFLSSTSGGHDEEPPRGHPHTFREHIKKTLFNAKGEEQ